MTKVLDQEIVGLELRYDVEQDTLDVRLIVGVNINVEPLIPVAHVVTVMAQRVDNLFSRDEHEEADLGDRVFDGFAICDPGGLLNDTSHEVLKVFVELFVRRRWPELAKLCEIVHCEEEE